MAGGDFPGWLAGLLGRAATHGLTDRAASASIRPCAHYGKCFIERSQRRAKHAAIVVANHALVMIRAAQAARKASFPVTMSSTKAIISSMPPTAPLPPICRAARATSCGAG